MTTQTQQWTTEERFGRALRYAEGLYAKRHKKGFQARIGERTGIPTSNLSSIVTKDRGAGEDTRRKILDASTALVPELAGMSYDMILDFGGLLLSGVPANTALEQARARYNLHIPRIHAHAVPSPGEAADIITDDLCQLIRASMARMDLDQRIELRAKVKLLLDDAGGEAISTSESASNPDNLL